MRKILKYIILSSFVIISACSSDKDIKVKSIRELYENGYNQFDKGNYKESAEEFLKIADEYPSSDDVPNSLIFSSYASYMAGDFDESLLSINRFFRFYPGNKEADYMLYLKGMCFYNQVSDVRRDQSMSEFALQSFKELSERFPKSKYKENVQNKILILENYLSAKLMFRAKLDMIKQNWPSAISKLQTIVLSGKNTVLVPEALYRLTESYKAIGLNEQSEGFAKILKLNFKDNVWTKKL